MEYSDVHTIQFDLDEIISIQIHSIKTIEQIIYQIYKLYNITNNDNTKNRRLNEIRQFKEILSDIDRLKLTTKSISIILY